MKGLGDVPPVRVERTTTACQDCMRFPVPDGVLPPIAGGRAPTRVSCRRTMVIINPNSGTLRPAQRAAMLGRHLERSGINFEIRYTERAGHATEMVRGASFVAPASFGEKSEKDEEEEGAFDSVLVSGGDGTLREVCVGLLGKPEVVVAMAPQGTGNNVARDLGISTVEDGVGALVGGWVLRGDAMLLSHAGRVDGRDGELGRNLDISWNVVGLGLVGDGGRRAEECRCFGPLRYDCGGIASICSYVPRRVWISASDQSKKCTSLDSLLKKLSPPKKPEEKEPPISSFSAGAEKSEGVEPEIGESMPFGAAAVQITRCSGNGFPFVPCSQIADGKFDVLLMSSASKVTLALTFEAIKAGGGQIVGDYGCVYVQTTSFSIKQDDDGPEMTGNVDGDFDIKLPLKISCVPALTTFAIPPPIEL